MKPQNPSPKPNPHLQKAIACHQAGLLAEAIDHYKKVLKTSPDNARLLTTLGALSLQTGKFEDSLRFNKQSIKIDPKQAIAFAHLGSGYAQLNNPLEALASCDQALVLKPDFIEVYYNRGKVLETLKRYDEALASYHHALALKPDLTEAHYNCGNVLYELQHFAAAVHSYDQAIALRPHYAEAYGNRGNALRELNQPDAALANYQQAIALKPNFADAYNNQGMLFYNLKQFDKAWQSFDQAVKLNPDLKFLYVLRVFSKLRICHWHGLESDMAELAATYQSEKGMWEPFLALAIYDNPALQRKVAEQWTAKTHPPQALLPKLAEYPEHDKIRLGYFSADFRNHAVAFLSAELFEKHDRNRFEIIAFAFGEDTDDEMRTRLKSGFDCFIDIQALSDQEAAQLARTMEIDIAIDLGGHTANARTGIFAMRAAPIQVSYLGYAGTMGADYIDYLIADKMVIPAVNRQHYAEKIAFLPDSYMVNDTARQIAETSFSREAFNLPATGFVFCCFNTAFKINADIFSSWMRILGKVPGSVLWLPDYTPMLIDNLKQEAEQCSIAADRLIFARHMPLMEDHLARLRLADLFLDTLPYNAHTTACDALWAGLPVLTRLGESMAGRVAASLLNAIGLPELITLSQPQYEAQAIELAHQPQKLAAIRTKLAQNRLTTALFDTQRFTQHLEAAYARMYQLYRAELPPEDIYL